MTTAPPPPDDPKARRDALTRAVAGELARLHTPALVVDLDAVEHNVAAMLRRVGQPGRWRPHIKTVKQPTVVGLMLDAGVFRFKAATPAEVDLVLRAAADRALPQPVDVLLAYPASVPALATMQTLRRAHPHARIGLLADSPEHLAALVRGLGEPFELPAFDLWLDVDLGMHRTGSTPEIWREATLPHCHWLHPVGLHGYDGHLRWTEREAAHAGYDALLELAEVMPNSVRQLCTSGTHSYAHALAHAGLRADPWDHQVSPGTLVLSDRRSAPAAADLGLRQAAYVLSRVVARPGDDRITLDAGSKALAPDCPPPGCAVLGEPGLVPLTASEEHRPVKVESGPRPAHGSLAWLVPDHVCTTVNLHHEALYIRTDTVVGSAPVRARGHRPWQPLAALALGLGVMGGSGCQPITTDVDIQLLLPEDSTTLSRTNNVSTVLEPDGFSETIATNGLDFALAFEVPPDDTIRTLSVYLADDDELLAWGRTPAFRYAGATSGLSLLLAYAGELSPMALDFSAPDPAARAAPILDLGVLLLASDGSTLFIDAYQYAGDFAAPLEDPPAADDGVLVSAPDGGVLRVAWNDSLAVWRYDLSLDTWEGVALEGDLQARPGAAARVSDDGSQLWIVGGAEALDGLSLSLVEPEGDTPRLQPMAGVALDGPRNGAVLLSVQGQPVLVGGDDPSLPLAWHTTAGQGAGPTGAWSQLACAPRLDDAASVLCVGGLRDGEATADGLRIEANSTTVQLEELVAFLPYPLGDPRLLPDADALFAQGDGHWLQIDRSDLMVHEQPSLCPRATGGSLAMTPSGATLLVGGLDSEGAPLDRFYAFAPRAEL